MGTTHCQLLRLLVVGGWGPTRVSRRSLPLGLSRWAHHLELWVLELLVLELWVLELLLRVLLLLVHHRWALVLRHLHAGLEVLRRALLLLMLLWGSLHLHLRVWGHHLPHSRRCCRRRWCSQTGLLTCQVEDCIASGTVGSDYARSILLLGCCSLGCDHASRWHLRGWQGP